MKKTVSFDTELGVIELSIELTVNGNQIDAKAKVENIELISKASEVIDYLNLKANRNFDKKNKVHSRYIQERLNEGATLDICKKVIDLKVWDWKTRFEKSIEKDDRNMAQYLRPATLFNRTKFADYQEQVITREMNFTNKQKLKEKLKDQYKDTVALDYSANEQARQETLQTIKRLKEKYGANYWKHSNDETLVK